MSDVLALLQLADSFLPSGLFTQSFGLEQIVAADQPSPEVLAELLAAYAEQLVGPTDAVAAAWALRAADDLAAVQQIDRALEAMKLSSEARAGSRASGRALLRVGAQALDDRRAAEYARLVRGGAAPGHQAVAFGLLAAGLGLSAEETALAELHGFAAGWLAAAVRLGALDFMAAQRVRRGAAPALARAATASLELHWTAMHSWCPAVEIRQMQHAAAELRLFAS